VPNAVETLRWRGSSLELIDQRLLPQRAEYLACRTAAEVAAAIRDMAVRGAPAIGCAAAYGIALEALRPAFDSVADVHRVLGAAFGELAASRPTAVNLFWALERMRRVYEGARSGPPGELSQRLLDEAIAIHREDVQANVALGRHGAGLVPDGARIMTHCNAGALATAGHGTALGVVRSARDEGKRVSVVASETRPFLQGARLTAWEMVQEGIPVTLITDNMAGHLMQRGAVDMVIVGADRVAANGDVANKIGTYTLAVLAARHRLPFYVAAPLSTIDLNVADGAAIPIEERSPAEVTGFRGERWAPEGVEVVNPAFDVTPAALVTGLVTERGVASPLDEEGIRRLLASARG
jgi:methylthioribose-1-phosphate isomerase